MAVLAQLLVVSVLELANFSLVFFLSLLEFKVVVLVELLILFDMSLLNVFLSLLVSEDELLVLHVKFLLFQLLDAILSQFGLY